MGVNLRTKTLQSEAQNIFVLLDKSVQRDSLRDALEKQVDVKGERPVVLLSSFPHPKTKLRV